MSDLDPPDLPVEDARRRAPPLSLVWLVPLVALGIALFITWQTLSSRGPLIEISFRSADGVTADNTVLRYREVAVGVVEDVSFAPDLQSVIVSVRLDADIAPYVDDSARFWIVRPQVTARGVTGLSTVLSGVYLEGTWDAERGEPQSRFVGLPQAPLVTDSREGLQIRLTADGGGRLQAGAPVVFRGVDIGFLDTPELTPEGDSVVARAFIEAPHDRLITTGTRFWGASGFSVNLGTEGLSLDVASLAALLEGGVTFANVIPDAPQAEPNTTFVVFDSEQAARQTGGAGDVLGDVPFSVYFEGSVAGLAAGAPVELNGLRVGEVSAIGLAAEQGARTRLRADISLAGALLGLPEDATPQEVVDFIATAVAERGLRARLASQGMLSQSLKIELVEVEGAGDATLVTEDVPAPAIATTAPAVTDVAESARGVMDRIQNLPIEAILENAAQTLASLNRVLASDDVQQAPAEVVALITDARELLASQEIRDTIAAANDSLAEISALLTRVNESEAVPAVLEALERTNEIAGSVQDTAARLPDLIDRIDTIAAEAAAVPLQTLADSAAGVIAEVEALIASDEVAALPAALAASLENLEAATTDIRAITSGLAESDAAQTLTAALERTGSIARSIDETAAGLPGLVERIDAVMAQAAALPLDQLAASAEEILTSAAGIVGSEAAAALPARLDTALADLSAAVADVGDLTERVSQGPAVDNLLAALARTESIARSVDEAAAGLPGLLSRIDAVAAEAETLPLQELVTSAESLVVSAEALVSSEETAQVPAALAGALQQLDAALAELRAGGAVTNVNNALDSAAAAGDAIAAAAAGLPALADDLDRLIQTSEQVLATYGEASQFNNQTLGALRDLRDAARAVTSLARTIERQPGSILRGR